MYLCEILIKKYFEEVTLKMLSYIHIVSIILTLLLVIGVGFYSVRQVKSASDFTVGGRSISTSLVAGTIVGTLVGGASTVGTAELAFKYGFSAWWFTLGGGIACIILALFLAKPLRFSGASTGPGFLAQAYGREAGTLASIFSSLGIFLNIIAQILAAVALITSMFSISPSKAAFIAVFLVISYVIFGGVWGTGIVGTLKVILLYISMFVSGLLAYRLGGGITGFIQNFPEFPWFSLFGRGVSKDLAAGFSLVVGVLSTQTYLQAMFSGKNVQSSRNGALISGMIIPPIGLAGIFVGLYMRANFPTINAREALPMFILQYLPHWLGGVVLATLLISVVGTGAGLVLGVSTMLSQDIYKKMIAPQASDDKVLLFSRIAIIVVTALTLIFATGNMNSLILKWSFLSMGLRGATICFPLLGAIFMRKQIRPKVGIWAIVLAPLSTILWAIMGLEFIDPLYVGLFVSLGTLILGSLILKE
ncbi:MAG: solute:Na+ symporter, family [Clostridia bacterium]|jgi:SSS family solute:Na+ symporter|nr:solute:Na+ symporter, family [Clostridia bacterium]MDN5323015.1 solute:Na+ symporter, family [Clostridia bacterium]